MADGEGQNFQLEAWDWRYYAEKVRKAEYDLDEGEIKPYLQLDRIIAAAFDTATRLFGLSFAERTGSAALPSRCPHLGGDRQQTAATSASSSATTSRAPPSAAAPG